MDNELKKKLTSLGTAAVIGAAANGISNDMLEIAKMSQEKNKTGYTIEDDLNNKNYMEKIPNYTMANPQPTYTQTTTNQTTPTTYTQTTTTPPQAPVYTQPNQQQIYVEQVPVYTQPMYTQSQPTYTQTTTSQTTPTTYTQTTTTPTTTTPPTTTLSLKEQYPHLPIQENPNYSLEELMSFYDAYSLMQDALAYKTFSTNEGTLTELIEKQYNYELSVEDKKRYDTLLEDTRKLYEIGIKTYELGELEEFNVVYNKIFNDKKYMNLDDLVKIISININSRNEVIINNPSNYQMKDGKLYIDGVTIESMTPLKESVSLNNVMSLINMYSTIDSKSDDLNVLNILQIPNYIKQELHTPTSFSLCVNGTFYSYSEKDLGERINKRLLFLGKQLGLQTLRYEIIQEETNKKYIFYGYDTQGNKQYIDQNSNYSSALFQLLVEVYPSYNKSLGTGIGYFDGGFMQTYLKMWEQEEKELQNNQPKLQ